ncbi:hypothetical protein BG011_008125 [Mortierella polycephala]|uniref:Orc1-like AAA ATPase domain-containing protein n=1 Tax=Mortierella polycephala TaxID=41804 RepID=A0A9P6TXX6_9FUNG|nr:hypothetical protein BG011_008125 [Mortierella polycephala]
MSSQPLNLSHDSNNADCINQSQAPTSSNSTSSASDRIDTTAPKRSEPTAGSGLGTIEARDTDMVREKETEKKMTTMDKNSSDNSTKAAQWLFKPYTQPSSISTTATSALMPTTVPTIGSTAPKSSLAKAGMPRPMALPTKAPVSLYASLQATLASGTLVGIASRPQGGTHTATVHSSRTAGPYSSHPPHIPATPLHINIQTTLPPIKDLSKHNNPYRAPSHTNSRAFIPPKVPGYEFPGGGSQAGNMGLMLGRRLSDGVPVTAKLHQSRVLLQHEYRIYKRLKIANARYDPNYPPLTQSDAELESNHQQGSQQSGKTESPTSATATETPPETCRPKSSYSGSIYEAGGDESEKFFLRIVHDFIDLDHDDMSVLMLERLGPNLLSHTHHRFLGLEDDGLHCPETQPKLPLGSSFPDVYTFLVFALKAACMLEGLLQINLAHLAICPTALHWMPAETNNGHSGYDEHQLLDPDGSKSYAYPSSTSSPQPQPSNANSEFYAFLESMDVNNTKIRLFDFTHSKILSHERARAPNNIVEWQIPGYLEYHLQFLAPEQTGRAETWMDHRTDIYGLGASLFSLLTMQFPYAGQDSVQILQGVLSKELPPLRDFRPDMPPVIDDILRKMTQKQPSQRYQNAFGFKQDILRCLNELHRTGRIDSFELGKHDMSYQFVLPNTVFGRRSEQQLISAAIAQAANAYQQSLNNGPEDGNDDDIAALRVKVANDSDHYVFMDDIVPLQNKISAKIPLSSKMLLRTPKPIGDSKSVLRGTEINDPVIRVIFVRGPSGVGKTALIHGMAAVARNSGLFAGGAFEAEGSAPYSAILQCIQSVLQQLLAQHTDALASLIVTIRTAFEPSSGIGIICDLVPELRFFFAESEMPESKDVPLTHSVARFHALILKLIRVISTHFFMTWLIDDLDFADESSIDLLATLVNVNKRLPIILIVTHTDTVDCLMKVKHILGGGNISDSQFPAGFGALGAVHHDSVVDDLSSKGHSSSTSSSSFTPISKATAIQASGHPMVVRGGGGVRYIPLQNPSMETIQEFLVTVLHRNKEDVVSLAKVLHGKPWLTVRQLVLELYMNHTIHFRCQTRQWEWESCPKTLAEVVRQLTGEEYTFLEGRFRALDSDTKRTLICASICGPVFTIQDLQLLVAATYSWEDDTSQTATNTPTQSQQSTSSSRVDTLSEKVNKGCNSMAGLQTAIQDGILVYTSVADRLRFQHGVMRRVAIDLIESQEETERLHFEMAKILLNTPRREFRTANHILQCLNLIKSTLVTGSQPSGAAIDATTVGMDCASNAPKPVELDVRAVRMILSHAGEKSQKSGAQDMALAYWNAALSLLPENCWTQNPTGDENDVKNDGEDVVIQDASVPSSPTSPTALTEGDQNLLWRQQPLYNESLKLHLQCIEAERWRENFDQAMKICEVVLANVSDPIDRARVYQHQIEMFVWTYSAPGKATATAIKSLLELGMPEDTVFDPTLEEIRKIFDRTHAMLLQHMPELQKQPPKVCNDPRIAMMMEVLAISSASLYYCNVSFIASAISQSMRLICEHGVAKISGRALVSFALIYSAWYGCYDNAYELGK